MIDTGTFGRLQHAGVIPFPADKEIACHAYDFDLFPHECDAATVRFLSPIDEVPRRFFAEGSLQASLGHSTSFVEDACEWGFAALQQYDLQPFDTTDLHRVMSSLFRNRRAGHTAHRHAFGDVRDFVVFHPQSHAEVLLPGLGNPETARPATASTTEAARQVLREALRDAEIREIKGIQEVRRPADIITLYQKMLVDAIDKDQGTNEEQLPFTTMPIGRSLLDLVFTEGVDLRLPDAGHAQHELEGLVPLSFVQTMDKVARSLIADARILEACVATSEQPERFAHFVTRLEEAANSKGVAEFDKWLTNERQRAFVRFVPGGDKLRDEQREDASQWATNAFRLLLWYSYCWMSRCYGVVMLLAWLTLCDDSSLSLTDEECRLFKRMNLPQLHLAGLPLAFFDCPQLKWIVGVLPDVWMVGDTHPELQTTVTDLLGIYGDLAENRRRADRQIYALKDVKERTVQLDSIEKEDQSYGVDLEMAYDAAAAPAFLESPECPKCGVHLQNAHVLDDSPAEWCIISVYCPKCDVESAYRVEFPR